MQTKSKEEKTRGVEVSSLKQAVHLKSILLEDLRGVSSFSKNGVLFSVLDRHSSLWNQGHTWDLTLLQILLLSQSVQKSMEPT